MQLYGSTLLRKFESLVIFLSDIEPGYVLETKQMLELGVTATSIFTVLWCLYSNQVNF